MSQDDINASFHKRLKRLEKGTDMVTEDSTPPQSHLEPSSSLQEKLWKVLDKAIKIAFERGVSNYDKSDKEYLAIKDSTRSELTEITLFYILKAFEEADYVQNPELTIMNYRYNFKTKQFYDLETKEHGVLMTGQKFFDRFRAELDKLNPSMRLEAWNLVFEAARLAAGVSDE